MAITLKILRNSVKMAPVKKKVGKNPKNVTPKTKTSVLLDKLTPPIPKKEPIFKPDSKNRRYWLVKSEPFSRLDPKTGQDARFSVGDLARVDKEPWDGVRNYEAKNNLLNMAKGDICLFYHSNCKNPGIVGLAKVASEHAIPDRMQFRETSAYFDPKATPEEPRWWCPEVRFLCLLKRKLSLQELKESGKFSELFLLKRGRLSVNPVSAAHFNALIELQNEGQGVDDKEVEFDCNVEGVREFDEKLLD